VVLSNYTLWRIPGSWHVNALQARKNLITIPMTGVMRVIGVGLQEAFEQARQIFDGWPALCLDGSCPSWMHLCEMKMIVIAP
jgi:hypothetical protein